MSTVGQVLQAAVLAVDGGGTHCRAGLYDLSGRRLAYVTGGPSNYQSAGSEAVYHTFMDVFLRLRLLFAGEAVDGPNASTERLEVQVGVFALAGLDTDQDRVILDGIIRQSLEQSGITATQVILENDALMTLKGHLSDNPGLLVISGTGSIVCGQNREKSTHRAGGWGHRVGDEGSGFAIGQAALRHIFRIEDGRDASSGIPGAVLQSLSLPSTEALLGWVYSSEYSPCQVAGLAKVVSQLAVSGDQVAASIVLSAASDLATIATSVVHHLELRSERAVAVMLSGGVLQGSSMFRMEVVDTLTQQFSNLKIIERKHEPIYSAALYGLYQLGCKELMS